MLNRLTRPPFSGARALWQRLASAFFRARNSRRFHPPAASVATHLALLSIGLAVPLLALAIYLLSVFTAALHRNVDAELDSNVKLLASLVDNEIDTSVSLASGLGRMTYLQQGDLAGFRQQAALALQSLPGAWLTVSDPAGTELLSTLEPAKAAAAPHNSRDTVQRAAASGKPEVSDIVDIDGAPRGTTFVAVPVKDHAGAPHFVLSVALRPENLQNLIIGNSRPDYILGIVDRQGRFIARVPYSGHPAGTLASEGLRTAIAQIAVGTGEFRSVEGDMSFQNWRRTSYGWTAAMAYKRDAVDAQIDSASRAVWRTAAMGLGLASILTWLLARRITKPASLLASAASSLARGEDVAHVPSGITEYDSAGAHFARVAHYLKGRNEAIQRSEVRLQLALDAAQTGTWIWRPQADEYVLDARAHEILGLNPAAHIDSKIMQELIHPADRAMVKAAAEKARSPDSDALYNAEFRIVTGLNGERWISSRARAYLADPALSQFIGVVRDITRRKRYEIHIRDLLNEVNHRSKNLLAVVQAIARLTPPDGDTKAFVARLSNRLNGLAACQDLLVKTEWQGVDLAELIVAQLAHYEDFIGDRILLDGPAVQLTPAAAQCIGMAIYELGTNAGKYGALSNTTGKVQLTWRLDAGQITIRWLEDGGPTVTAPVHKGFGNIVIGRMIESAIQALTEIDYRPSGVVWTMTAPAARAMDQGTRDIRHEWPNETRPENAER